MSARDQVLALPEMLEAILLEVPMCDLLVSQRTCKSWQSAILQSTPLQRKLFFRPIGEVPLALSSLKVEEPFEDIMSLRGWHHLLHGYNEAIYHPDGQGLCKDPNLEYMWIPSDSPIRVAVEEDDAAKPQAVEVYLNPAFNALIRELDTAAPDIVKDPTPLPPPWQRPEASWRRMHLTQPPIIASKMSIQGVGGSPTVKCSWPTTGKGGKYQAWNFDSGCPWQLGPMVDMASRKFREQYASEGMGHSNCVRPYRLEFRLWGAQLWEQMPEEGWQVGRYGDDPGNLFA